MTGVLGSANVGGSKHVQRTQADVARVADWGCHKV
jgi:hypothetical protein